MRLIDADAFERKVMCGDEEDVQDVIYSLRDFPTAYSVDKVVQQIKSLSPANYVSKDDVLKIVKGGGADGKS